MGKEKKHKKEKKRHRSRSRERRRKHKHKDRSRRRERSDSEEEDVEVIRLKQAISNIGSTEKVTSPKRKRSESLSPSPPSAKVPRTEAPPSPQHAGTKDAASLSIEETNRIRAKLGLKPLEVNSEIPGLGGDLPLIQTTDGTRAFVHKPAESLTAKKRTENIKQKLEARKERRRIEDKLSKVKTLGVSDSEDETIAWVKKSRKISAEKLKAEQRAKLLDQMDAEFGVSNLVEDEFALDKAKLRSYGSKDLKGILVQHSQEKFTEGREVVLTLQDSEVLAGSHDVLENVNFAESERTAKNVENKKGKPGYNPYDMEDIDEYGVVTKKDILSKYNEELEGEKKESFTLGMGSADVIRKKLLIKQKLAAEQGKVSLQTPALQLATEYYTPDEMKAKFKKIRKKPRKVRKKEKVLKANDLISNNAEDEDAFLYGNQNVITINSEDEDDVGDLEDLSKIVIDPDEAELELQEALNKTRKIKNKAKKLDTKSIAEMTAEITLQPLNNAITLNETAEFCRSLGDMPTYGQSGNRDEEADELMDMDIEEDKMEAQEEEEFRTSEWKEVDVDSRVVEKKFVDESVPILEEEPDVSVGIAAALEMAKKKGYLDSGLNKQPAVSRVSQLRAQNYSIEDKNFEDDKQRSRGDRYNGPLVDFCEKDHYRPAVKLEYIDDGGRILTSKEAFRHLSHKFHGKGSGKNKTEKRMKKQQETARVKEMSSTDTPLGTLNKLQEKQKQSQTPYLLLSGQNKQLQPLSKGK